MTSKKTAVVALLMTLILAGQSAIAPRRAHAVIAGVTGGDGIPALIVFGAGVGVGGLVGDIVSVSGPRGGLLDRVSMGAYIVLAGIVVAAIGLVMLDETGAPTPDFATLTPQEASEAGILPVEVRQHNRQLDRINAASESIARGIRDAGITDERAAIEFAHAHWQLAHESGEIGDAAYAAVTKRCALALGKAQAAAHRQL